ncbi:hypothetical protein ACJ73_08233 [Blastomyces percursus]|uniref:Integrase catalytic domain-containing protein n=1 Tax=Blastomyces percursus TaxID=1658174 RepID=A0A1J9PVP6_9EURO|nr:hypothetical protein ACJ73_08233 [Blastomyces percursus]
MSKKLSPPECNYEIYNKELLAIVRCLEEWDSVLRSVPKFEIITDHKNLKHFTTTRKLTERQMRWSEFVSRFHFTIHYRPGSQNSMADALSRREQDLPSDAADTRRTNREHRILDPKILIDHDETVHGTIRASVVKVLPLRAVLNTPDASPELSLDELWRTSALADEQLQALTNAFRGRRWVPQSETLRTRIMQETQDSRMTGHPGREQLYRIISREYYWPEISDNIRRFLRNCNRCSSVAAWKDRRKGLLKPLDVPERIWRDVAIDFAVDLPESKGCKNIMVIVDRLSNGVILESCDKIDTERVAEAFLRSPFDRMHGLPRSIVSDQGRQFTVKNYHHKFCNYPQEDWHDLLLHAEVAINVRDAVSTGIWASPRNPIEIAENIVTKLRDARDWAEASMASAKQDREDQANLSLKNMRTTGPSRTLDDRHARYEVLEVLGSQNCRLNAPLGIVGEDNELEWEIEEILDERPQGRGRQYLVKCVGYDRPSWTAGSALSETAALDRWEALGSGEGAYYVCDGLRPY